jgi:hypothetical protein
LLEAGASVDSDTVQHALRKGDLEIVQALLGATSFSQTYGACLYTASFHKHLHIVQWLLEKGAGIETAFEHHGNGLYAASESGQLAIVQLLLGHGADVNNFCGEHGTALCAASAYGHASIVKTLLDSGAKIDAPGSRHDNALHAALARGHNEVVRILAERGADLNVPPESLTSALQAAVLASGDPVPLQTLIDNGGDVNLQGGRYGNVLQAACVGLCREESCMGSGFGRERKSCRAKIVQLLLDQGALINAEGGHYGSALRAAYARSCEQVIQLLLDRGADLSAKRGSCGSVESARTARDSGDRIEAEKYASNRYRRERIERHMAGLAAVPGSSLATAIVLEES